MTKQCYQTNLVRQPFLNNIIRQAFPFGEYNQLLNNHKKESINANFVFPLIITPVLLYLCNYSFFIINLSFS